LGLGITSEHVPELIRILEEIEIYWGEAEDNDEVWAPNHAWRALGQLRASEAIDALIELLDLNEELESDWLMEEVPEALGMIGPVGIPALQACLISQGSRIWAAISVGASLFEIGKRHPESREACVAALQAGLEGFAHQDETLNGFLIYYLSELKAVEADPLVERAYQADRVDISILGDYEDFQISVGLLEKRLTPPPEYQWVYDPGPDGVAQWQAEKEAQREAGRRERRKAKKEKKKRKQAKKARRRKRKR
jgi:hypothetical protein